MLKKSLPCIALLLFLSIVGCGHSSEVAVPTDTDTVGDGAAAIAVSNSYLAAATREVLGERTPLVTLAEPGMCPGHFDLRPSQVRQALNCRVLIRFNFQASLDARFQAAGTRPPRIVSVAVAGGLCEPASFVAACRQIAEALVDAGLLTQEQGDERIAVASRRMEELEGWARCQVEKAGLVAMRVLASQHQAAFCRWLGLDVVGTFPAADTTVPSQIDQAVEQGKKAGIRLIVANLPQGRQAADALADRFGAKVVVFGNFPETDEPQAVDQLIRGNVTRLVDAARP